MNRFRLPLTLCGAALLFLLFSAPAFAQSPPDSLARDAKTWSRLNSIVAELKTIRALAVDANSALSLHKSAANAARDQASYLRHLNVIQADCASIGYADLLAFVDISDRLGVSSLSFTGTIQGAAMLQYSNVLLSVSQSATAAQITIELRLPTGLQSAITQPGILRINGHKIYATTSDTYQTLLYKIMNVASQNDVTVAIGGMTPDGNFALTVQRLTPGSQFSLRIQDPNGFLMGPPLKISTGSDAIATLTLLPYDGTRDYQITPLFGGSEQGDSGLTLRDEDGTILTLMGAGNAVYDNLPIGNQGYIHFTPADLGTDFVSGFSLANMDMTTLAGASNAVGIVGRSSTQMAGTKQAFLQSHPKFHP